MLKTALPAMIALVIVLLLTLVIIWLATGTREPAEFATITPPNGAFSSKLLVSPDDEFIVVGSSWLGPALPELLQGELSVWKMRDRSMLKAIELPRYASFLSMDKKGTLLVVGMGAQKSVGRPVYDGKPRQIRIYSFPELKEIHRIESEEFVKSAILSPDGTLLAAAVEIEGRARAEVIVWDTSDWKVKYKISDFFWWTTTVRFSPDGKLLGVTDYKQGGPFNPIGARIRLHEASTGKRTSDIAVMPTEIPMSFEFLTNDRFAIQSRQAISFWRADGVEDGDTIRLEILRDRQFFLSADRKLQMISNPRDHASRPKKSGQVILWDIDAKKVLRQWDRQNAGPLAITSDKKKLAMGWDKVYLYDLD